MRSLLLASILILSASAFAEPDSTGNALYYHFENTGSLLLKGQVAEDMYRRLSARETLIQDPDYRSLRRQGENISCYFLVNQNEYQCVISVSDRSRGAVASMRKPEN